MLHINNQILQLQNDFIFVLKQILLFKPFSCRKIYKMNELKSIETCSDLRKEFRLNEINKIKDYFVCEIKEKETVVKKLSKYITYFDYTDKVLIALSTAFSGVTIFFSFKN